MIHFDLNENLITWQWKHFYKHGVNSCIFEGLKTEKFFFSRLTRNAIKYDAHIEKATILSLDNREKLIKQQVIRSWCYGANEEIDSYSKFI